MSSAECLLQQRKVYMFLFWIINLWEEHCNVLRSYFPKETFLISKILGKTTLILYMFQFKGSALSFKEVTFWAWYLLIQNSLH